MDAARSIDYDRLHGLLDALSYAGRLELLHILRYPHALQDIRVTPGQNRPGENPERPVSRQSIQKHLARLIDVGVVQAVDVDGKRGRKQYVVNPQALFEILEEMREVFAIPSHGEVDPGATHALGRADVRPPQPGPKLVVVHGLLEGKVFPLRHTDLAGRRRAPAVAALLGKNADAAGRAAKRGAQPASALGTDSSDDESERGWVIGRKLGLHVSLDYDPYVSQENSEIVHEGQTFHLLDLRTSRNGTWLNWRRLSKDERAPLASGDIVGVGRSLLVFRAE